MESPAQPILRPLRLGELLDRAIRLYRGNFLTFIGIIAVVYVPLTVLQTALSALMSGSLYADRFSTPEELISSYAWISSLLILILLLAQYVLVNGIATGALTRAVADNYLGKQSSILDAYRGIGRSWPTLLAALAFVLMVLCVVLVWSLIPCIGWFTSLGMVLFLMGVINPLVAPVVVLEAAGPWSSPNENIIQRFSNWIVRSVLAVNRAWSLARRRFWPVLGYTLILYLFSLIVVNGPTALAGFLLDLILPSLGDMTTQVVITSLAQGLISLIFVLIYYPLQMTAFTLIYFDLRVRTEGFDIAVLTMDNSGSTDLAEATNLPAPQVNERFMTGAELGNFAIITLAGLGLYTFFFLFLLLLAFSTSLLY